MTDKQVSATKTQREVAKILDIARSTVSRVEDMALSKLNTLLLMNEENTHLLAHKPDIKEIDMIFKTLPWCKFIKTPRRGEKHYDGNYQVISRLEWTKSFDETDKKIILEGGYKVT